VRLISWLVWRYFGAYRVDEEMLAGMLEAIDEGFPGEGQ
jgi:hypothetical protein